MPRKTKETGENEIVKIANAIKEVLAKNITLKKDDSKKSTTAKKASSSKSTTSKKASSSKSSSSKKATTSKTKNSKNASEAKSATAKKSASSKASTSKKASTVKTASAKKSSKAKNTTVNKTSEAKSATAKKSTTSKASTSKKSSTTKPASAKKTSTAKNTAAKKASKAKSETTKKASTSKTATAKKASTSKAKTTKKSSKSTTAKKATTSKKAISKKVSELSNKKFSAEYYDLPFRYNQTVVKILAQTPKNLFVYWEISDEDREKLKNQYGEYFFEITKPVLIIYNETLNYTFEIDIDDFANSWYLHVDDSNSEYKVELGRRPIPVNYSYIPDYDIEKNGPIEELKTPYFYISSSNELDAPNDRILFNKISKVYFRNVKTNELIEKDISDFPSIYKDGIFINIYKLYQELYKEEIKNDSFNLYNPSSGNIGSGSFSSRFY